MPPLSVSDAIELLRTARTSEAASALRALADDGSALPRDFLHLQAEAVERDDYSCLSEAFLSKQFVGPAQEFLFVAPFRVRRQGAEQVVLTGVHGRMIPTEPAPDFERLIRDITSQPSIDRVDRILPFWRLDGFGAAAGGPDGEAFLVPDGWTLPNSEQGQGLLDMREQRSRFRLATKCIQTIFDDRSSELLLRGLLSDGDGVILQHREFQYHEAGHSSGIGLRTKTKEDLLKTPWLRGIEEWRADGIEFELLARNPGLSEEHIANTVAANLTLRFGVDAHRNNGFERDIDVIAVQNITHHLLEGGALEITPEKRLAFRDPTPSGLIQAIYSHKSAAIQLTRQEGNLPFHDQIWALYARTEVSQAAKVLFKGLVIEPCRGLHAGLK